MPGQLPARSPSQTKRRLILLALVVAGTISALGYQGRPVLTRSQLTWFDRSGKRVAVLGGFADYGNVELSPDGKQVAVAITDSDHGTRNLWLYDTPSGHRTMLSQNPADQNWLIWSPDRRRVVFNSGRNGGLDLYQAPASSKGTEEALLVDRLAKWPVSWSSDGRFILYVTSGTGTSNDIWVLPLFGDRKPYPFLQTADAENWAAFSPDGHWVAYSSTESGDSEVYVTPFPRSGPKWLVSKGGGSQARWRRDGRELFYLALDRRLMAVPVTGKGSDPEFGVAQPLFEIRVPYPQYHTYDVALNGQQFIVNTLILPAGTPAVSAH